VIVMPAYPIPIVVDSTDRSDTARPAEPARPSGRLWLDIKPITDQQLFIDGYYVGTTGELGPGLELAAGPHSIELRAAAFEPLRFNVSIAANRTLTYRESLKPAAGAPDAPEPARAIAAAPSTLYVIPGCYAGNVAPEAASLPKGCDRSRMTTLQP
jgi:hypothetical protein